MIVQRRRSTGRKGFTLAELVVVLVILAATAALLIPRLGFMKSQADNATSAAGVAQLTSNLETYKLTTGSYPLGMDSLLDSTGTLYSGLWSHPAGPSVIGPGGYLTAGTPLATSGDRQSFGHAFQSDASGNIYVYDHSTTATDPSSSATVVRNLAFDGSDSLAVVSPTTGAALIRAAGYPTGALPVGVQLVAFGIGPNNGAVGETMASAPRHAEQDQEFYGRYIALFAVYASGKPAELKAIVDSHGSTVESNISSYKKGGPSHD
jgi:prepilin-type N-terminal cleavage/methylation domain-containing protein